MSLERIAQGWPSLRSTGSCRETSGPERLSLALTIDHDRALQSAGVTVKLPTGAYMRLR